MLTRKAETKGERMDLSKYHVSYVLTPCGLVLFVVISNVCSSDTLNLLAESIFLSDLELLVLFLSSS